MSNAVTEAATVVPPAIYGGVAGTKYAESVGTTHVVRPLSSAWVGRRVSVSTSGGRCAFVIGTANTVEADVNAVVTGATSAGWTDNQKIGNQISDGETRDFFIPMLLDGVPFTHFSVECSATALVTILPSDLINTNPAHSHRPQ